MKVEARLLLTEHHPSYYHSSTFWEIIPHILTYLKNVAQAAVITLLLCTTYKRKKITVYGSLVLQKYFFVVCIHSVISTILLLLYHTKSIRFCGIYSLLFYYQTHSRQREYQQASGSSASLWRSWSVTWWGNPFLTSFRSRDFLVKFPAKEGKKSRQIKRGGK